MINTISLCVSCVFVSVRIDVRPRRLFIFKLGPAYTVDKILADATEELKPLQEFVLNVSGI